MAAARCSQAEELCGIRDSHVAELFSMNKAGYSQPGGLEQNV